MNEENEHITQDELIAKVLSGQATAVEQAELEDWIAQSSENALHFETSKMVWKKMGDLAAVESVDVDAAWKKVKAKAIDSDGPVVRDISSAANEDKARPMNFMRIAAGLAAVIGVVAVLYFTVFSGAERITVASGDVQQEISLPDGSQVVLNQNSTLAYMNEFTGETRLVELSGEGYFSVTRNEDQPFVVRTPDADVKVLGTAFNVSAYPDEEEVIVSVEEGTVALTEDVEDEAKEQVVLTQGNLGTLNKESGTIEKEEDGGLNNLFWKTKTLVFKRTQLKEVVKVLNKVYGVNISLKNKDLNKCKLSTTFNDLPIDSVISVIQETFNLEVQKNDKNIELSGDACY